MSPAQVLALASGPVIVLLHVIWSVDRNREPFLNVLKYLAIGGLVLAPGCQMERVALDVLGNPTEDPASASIPLLLAATVLGIGLVEELVKYAGLRLFARRDRHLDEPFDWVVYAVTVALGFALVENVLYVVNYGAEVATPRALFAVPAHALCGTLMGCRMARAATAPAAEAAGQRALALLEPAAWHGVYDFLAFAMSSRAEDAPVSGGTFAALFGFLVLLQWIRCVNQVRGLLVEGRPVPPVLLPLSGTRFVRRPVSPGRPPRP
ncbi:MAG: PrsW family intramembrane metalloprotease [Planctomycetes bacterium]|nr:PrsW family intramembrane metalloprotease [Planctomycetota bacterium]